MAKTAKHALPPLTASSSDIELLVDRDHFDRVVLGGILEAKTSLDIATANFKAMLVPTENRRHTRSIVEIMAKLADRGVEIRLLHSAVPSGPVLEALRKELPGNVTIRRCPRVHTKTVIVDCQRMYLGSANLTGAGLGAKGVRRRNFELGIWTSSATLIDGALDQFNSIWEGHHCDDCGRQNVCPEPLEEPDLIRVQL